MPAWLGGMFFKAVIEWLWGKISAAIKLWKKDQANHEAAVHQAALDNEKASQITPESKSDEVDEAITDSLKHI